MNNVIVPGARMELEQLRPLELACVTESVTLLLLLGIAAAKALGALDARVRIMGPVHGLALESF